MEQKFNSHFPTGILCKHLFTLRCGSEEGRKAIGELRLMHYHQMHTMHLNGDDDDQEKDSLVMMMMIRRMIFMVMMMLHIPSSKSNRLMLVSFPPVKSFQLQMGGNRMKWGTIEKFCHKMRTPFLFTFRWKQWLQCQLISSPAGGLMIWWRRKDVRGGQQVGVGGFQRVFTLGEMLSHWNSSVERQSSWNHILCV